LARLLGLDEASAQLIEQTSPMHDIGKIGIPDAVLLKPGKLDAREWEIMKRHTVIGAQILGDHPSETIRMARIIALNHHEQWNGAGYPAGLAGEAIPLAARITSICDVFDALITERPYKHAWPPAEAASYLRLEAGLRFDPLLVDVFLANLDEFVELAESLSDDAASDDAAEDQDTLDTRGTR
jgi:putative two-component system response regulator